jgi:hypothetical protein
MILPSSHQIILGRPLSSLNHVYPSPSHVRGHTAPSCGAAYALEGLFRDHIIGGEDYARD